MCSELNVIIKLFPFFFFFFSFVSSYNIPIQHVFYALFRNFFTYIPYMSMNFSNSECFSWKFTGFSCVLIQGKFYFTGSKFLIHKRQCFVLMFMMTLCWNFLTQIFILFFISWNRFKFKFCFNYILSKLL